MMVFNIITLFPDIFDGVFDTSILHRARQNGIIDIRIKDLRAFGLGVHRVVDDAPYGGGGGMVLKPEPIALTLKDIEKGPGHVILTTPKGRVLTHSDVLRLSKKDVITIICGHYEGVDERVRGLFVDEEISIGDYVLTGGEIPAMVIVYATSRLIPHVLGRDTFSTGDSHYNGLLEYPQYTRPKEFMGKSVPDVLLSGNHEQIRLWRRKMSLKKTKETRPDLFKMLTLSKADCDLLEEE
jgi:tRNA (guanine37-N1)-methyltransferase